MQLFIREITGKDELHAVEELQKEVWEIPDIDVVPLTQLIAAKKAGGVLIGAFDNDLLVGFSYGFAGFEHGKATHHSHMLGVKPTYRNHHLGYRLKLAQREFVLAQGIDEMTWTFDPLQSVNAYFNFRRLGVVSNDYLIDFYGVDASSSLHRNGTDRLWVRWNLDSRRVTERIEKEVAETKIDNAKPLLQMGNESRPVYVDSFGEQLPEKAFIEIPSRIGEVQNQNLEIAAVWRTATQTAFIKAFSLGFSVTDFVRGEIKGKYLLTRRSPDSV